MLQRTFSTLPEIVKVTELICVGIDKAYSCLWYQIELQLNMKSSEKPRLRSSESIVPSLVILPNGDALNLFSAQFQSIVEVLFSYY